MKTEIKLSNALKACNVIAPKNDIRYYFNGVALYFKDETLCYITATDGHQLIKVDINSDIDLRDCECLILCKSKIDLVCNLYGDLFASDFTSDKLDHNWLIEGRYPDIMRVIPNDDRNSDTGTIEIGLDVNYLANLKRISNEIKKGYKSQKLYNQWRFNIASASESVIADNNFRYNLSDNGKKYESLVSVKYVLMPCRL